MWKEAYVPQISSIHAAISTQYQLVTDRHIHRHRETANTVPEQHRMGNKTMYHLQRLIKQLPGKNKHISTTY